jgi:hypothetical protein
LARFKAMVKVRSKTRREIPLPTAEDFRRHAERQAETRNRDAKSDSLLRSRLLEQVEQLRDEGRTIAEATNALNIRASDYVLWREEWGPLRLDEVRLKLRQANQLLREGKTIAEVIQVLELNEVNYKTWRRWTLTEKIRWWPFAYAGPFRYQLIASKLVEAEELLRQGLSVSEVASALRVKESDLQACRKLLAPTPAHVIEQLLDQADNLLRQGTHPAEVSHALKVDSETYKTWRYVFGYPKIRVRRRAVLPGGMLRIGPRKKTIETTRTLPRDRVEEAITLLTFGCLLIWSLVAHNWLGYGEIAGGAFGTVTGLVAIIFLLAIWSILWLIRLVHDEEAFLKSGARLLTGCFALVVIDLIGTFAYGYLAIDHYTPGSFHEPLNPLTAVYLATTTFTTVGSGGIYPTMSAARAAVTAESGCSVGVLLIGLSLLLARFRARGD